MNLDAAQLRKLLTEDTEADDHVIEVRMSLSEVKQLLLENGYKIQSLANGETDFHPVVYKAAKALVLKTAILLLPAIDPKNIVVEFY